MIFCVTKIEIIFFSFHVKLSSEKVKKGKAKKQKYRMGSHMFLACLKAHKLDFFIEKTFHDYLA